MSNIIYSRALLIGTVHNYTSNDLKITYERNYYYKFKLKLENLKTQKLGNFKTDVITSTLGNIVLISWLSAHQVLPGLVQSLVSVQVVKSRTIQ